MSTTLIFPSVTKGHALNRTQQPEEKQEGDSSMHFEESRRGEAWWRKQGAGGHASLHTPHFNVFNGKVLPVEHRSERLPATVAA